MSTYTVANIKVICLSLKINKICKKGLHYHRSLIQCPPSLFIQRNKQGKGSSVITFYSFPAQLQLGEPHSIYCFKDCKAVNLMVCSCTYLWIGEKYQVECSCLSIADCTSSIWDISRMCEYSVNQVLSTAESSSSGVILSVPDSGLLYPCPRGSSSKRQRWHL